MNRHLHVLGWLVGLVFILSALMNLFFVFQQTVLQNELRRLDEQNGQAQLSQVETIIRNLVGDLAVYGQKQPSIFGVLQKYGVNPPPPPSTAQKSTPRPPR